MSDDATKRKLTQPPDWWAAFEAAAAAAGMSLSEWLGDAAKRRLPKGVRDGLSDRRGRGQPRKEPAA